MQSLDCICGVDPNRPMAEWKAHGGQQENLTVTVNADEETILENINDAAEEADFVIVDLEGTASLSVEHEP